MRWLLDMKIRGKLTLAFAVVVGLMVFVGVFAIQRMTALHESADDMADNWMPALGKIERIRVEDSGSRIDELRVGGETQSITVSPKGNMPAYDVLPASANRAPSGGERNSASGSGGTRVWKILGF